MANEGGLGMDLSKVNVYGANDEQLSAIQEALQKNISALEQRYSQPNWFKVAAGFAKPQLGGFIASLGSANEALGETVEKQREAELPLAQMRSQLAQSNLLLSQNKKAADLVAERRSKGLPITPDFVGEIMRIAPSSPLAQSLSAELGTQQKQQEITASLQRNALTAAAEARNLGLKVDPEVFRQAGLLPPGAVGAGASHLPPLNRESDENIPSSNIKNSGLKLNEEQTDLKNMGIPIISGIRTEDEQDALRDHRDSNGNWVTKNGLPVANNSQHIQGTAIDVDSSKLTPEQKQVLRGKGYFQPLPDSDPNHWQKIEGAPGKQNLITIGRENTAFNPLYTPAQAADNKSLSRKEQEKIANERFNALEAVANPQTYGTLNGQIDSLIQKLQSDPKRSERVLNIVIGQGGFGGAIRNALSKGVGFNVQNITGNVQVPIESFLTGALSKEDYDFLRSIRADAAKIAQYQQKIENVNPNGISNVEAGLFKDISFDPSKDSLRVALYNLYNTKINLGMLHEMLSTVNSINQGRHNRYKLNENSDTPMSDIFSSVALSEASKPFDYERKDLNSSFLNSLKPKVAKGSR